MSLPDIVSIRDMRDADLNFIRSSWLKSYSSYCPCPDPKAFFPVHWDVVMGLMDRADAKIAIACASDDEDHILGWACAEPRIQVFHWAYVKSAVRYQGIGKALIARVLDGSKSGGIVATHVAGSDLMATMVKRGWVFRPQVAFYLALRGSKEAA